MGARASGTPRLEALPVLAWLGVMASGLVGLVLLATGWTSGTLPGATSPAASAAVGPVALYVAFLLPPALVLAMGILVVRVRWKEPEFVEEWAAGSPSGPASGAGE